MKSGEEDWLKEILPSIGTLRNQSGAEIPNPKLSDITDQTLFVIKSDEFIKFATLIELESVRGVLSGSKNLLSEAKSSNETAMGLLTEARGSGKTASFTFKAAIVTLIAAILIPPLVVKLMISTVEITAISLSDEQISALAKKINLSQQRK